MNIENIIQKSLSPRFLRVGETIQSLWSGYGSIIRYELEGSSVPSVIVKHVRYSGSSGHPRGWDTDLSHKRKTHSYKVETRWYRDYASLCDEHCRIPRCFALESSEDEVIMVLEDLDASGFPVRKQSVSPRDMDSCLKWLAYFHALHLHRKTEGLWDVGCYWHLETRPQELDVLEDRALKEAAATIDQKLNSARYQTLVHGDAKLANFCFPSRQGTPVSAVDFQYIGGGCGMKDLAYFVGSCLYEDECEKQEDSVLNSYFSYLKQALVHYEKDEDFDALESEWRMLYPWAWTDFHRFLKGWSPGHWKVNSYSERISRNILESL